MRGQPGSIEGMRAPGSAGLANAVRAHAALANSMAALAPVVPAGAAASVSTVLVNGTVLVSTVVVSTAADAQDRLWRCGAG
jgi:hypothetical protein